MTEWSWVATAYGVAWAVIAGYAVYLSVRMRRARNRLERAVLDTEEAR